MASALTDGEMIEEAVRIVEVARERGIILRILGAIAVRIHSAGLEGLHKRLGRLGDSERSFTDIDLIGYSSQHGEIRKLMERELSFNISRQFLLLYGRERLLYHHPQNLYRVDIFFDKLAFSHDIPFGKMGRGRLELDYPTITATDLLLEKLQIHQINEKDIKDILVLLKAHELARGEGDHINVEYIAELLGDDWGFWMDATENLRKALAFARRYRDESLLSDDDLKEIEEKIQRLLGVLDKCPKTRNWHKRAREGARRKYWRDVEELYG